MFHSQPSILGVPPLDGNLHLGTLMTPRALKIHWKGLLQQGKSIEFPGLDGPVGTSWGLVAQRKLTESLRFVLNDLLERRGDPLQEVEGSSKKWESLCPRWKWRPNTTTNYKANSTFQSHRLKDKQSTSKRCSQRDRLGEWEAASHHAAAWRGTSITTRVIQALRGGGSWWTPSVGPRG